MAKELTQREMASRGGKARATKLTPSQRQQIASKGGKARKRKLTPTRRRAIATVAGEASAKARKSST